VCVFAVTNGSRVLPHAEELRAALSSFSTPGRLEGMCTLVLQRLLGLRGGDLEAWATDPEDFMLEEEQVWFCLCVQLRGMCLLSRATGGS
jgi:hypothetical protein